MKGSLRVINIIHNYLFVVQQALKARAAKKDWAKEIRQNNTVKIYKSIIKKLSRENKPTILIIWMRLNLEGFFSFILW